MACGMYYKLPRSPKPPTLYGYGKSNRQSIIDVVNRLHRPSISTIPVTTPHPSTEQNETSTNPDELISSIQTDTLPNEGASSPGEVAILSATNQSRIMKPYLRDICKRIRSEELEKRQLQRARVPVMDDAQIEKIFKRLQRSSTKAWELRQQQNQEKEKPTAIKKRPKSAVSTTVSTTSHISRPSSNDMQCEVRMKEMIAIQQRKMNQLCLHTTVSGMKKRGVCAFCELKRAKELQKQEEESQMLDFLDPFSNLRVNDAFIPVKEKPKEATFASVEVEKAHVERMLAPTRASQGGLPLCEKMSSNSFFHHSYCCHPTSQIVYGSKGLPLICGLKRSEKSEDIFNRLSRPKSSVY